jgi:hypothetical protein
MPRTNSASQHAADADNLKPFILPWISASVAAQIGQAGTSATLTAHDLDGPLHLGALARSQAPWVATDITSAIATHAALPDVHHARQHNMLSSSDHVYSGGAALDVFGLSAPGTLAVLTPSAAPGAASMLLKSSAAGDLTLPTFTATTRVRTPLLDTASGNLTLAPAGGTTAITGALTVSTTATVTTSIQTPLLTTATNVDLLIDPGGTGAVKFPNTQTLRTSTFDSSFPITGWQINEVAGISGKSALTIGQIQADELSVRVFVADEVRVDRGDEYWTKSYGIIADGFTTPASIGGTVSVKFEDSPAISGAIFSNNDWLLIRKLEIGTGLTLFSIWGQVSSYVNNADATQNWTFTLRNGPTSAAITKGSIGIDFGASGAALIHLSVIDAAGAPYIKLRRWSGANPYTPGNFTTYVQMGNLGSVGNSLYTPAGDGIYIRSTAAEGKFIVADNNGIQLRGVDYKAFNGSAQTVSIASADGSVKLGTDISSPATTNLDFNGGTGALAITGDLSAADGDVTANAYGLNISAFNNTGYSWTDWGKGLKFTTNTALPSASNVVGQIFGERYTASSPSFNMLRIVARSGAAYGASDAYVAISASDMDTSFGIASIDLNVSDTVANVVRIVSQTAAGASSDIALVGNTQTYLVRPALTDTYDLGTSTYYYNHAYIRNLHTDTVVGTPAFAHSHAATDITSGVLDLARIPATLTGKDADTLDTYHASSFSLTSHHHDSDYVGALTQGGGISITGTIAGYTIAHVDTSTAGNVAGTGGTVVNGLTFDTFGHVTATTTTNLDSRYVQTSGLAGYVPTTRQVIAGAAMVGGGALSADVTLGHADTSTQANVANTGVNFISGLTFDTYGHVTGVTSGSVSSALDALYVNVAGDTMTGNLTIDVDAIGLTGYIALKTATATNRQWQFLAAAHDFTVVAEDLFINFYDGTTTTTALRLDNSNVAAQFGGDVSGVAWAITSAGVATFANNIDTTHVFGRAKIGFAAAADSATFAHFDHNTATNLALAQYADGSVQLNTATGQEIMLSVNDVATVAVNADRMMPRGSVLVDLGDYNRKYRTIHAAEMSVQTLVSEKVIATAGGQVIVTPSSKLIADISSTAGSGTGGSSLATNLVGYWALDEVSGTRLDSTANANHLADKNTVASTTGKIGTAALFDLANAERLWKADNAVLSTGDIQFYGSCWVYATLDDGTSQCVVSKGGASGDRSWELIANWATNKFDFTVYSAANVATTISTATISVNTWYFVEWWHDSVGNTINIALNRTETTAAYANGVKDDGGNFTIGARNNALNFSGRVDELGFWKNYIPASIERNWLYNLGAGRNYTAIQSYNASVLNMDIEGNSFVSGEFIHLSAAPGGVAQNEVFQLTSGPSAITGGFRYTAVRNLDGTGANNWYAGDAVKSLGALVGSGYINLTATTTLHNHYGPTIAHYVRRGTGAWDSVAPVVASGNLRSFVDYVGDEFGHAAGNDLLLTPETGFKGYTIDTVNGMRTFNVDISLYDEDVAFLNIGTVSGFDIEINTTANNDNRALSFNLGGLPYSFIKAYDDSVTNNRLNVTVDDVTGRNSYMLLTAYAPVSKVAQITFSTDVNGSQGNNVNIYQGATVNDNYISLSSNNIRVLGTIGEFWTTLSFNTGWANYGSGFQNIGYKKVGDLVFLKGLVLRTSGTAATIATLPSGYRPAAECIFATTSNDAFSEIRVTTAGAINLVIGTATAWVSLDGIVFSIN